jgi:hypothetical protein
MMVHDVKWKTNSFKLIKEHGKVNSLRTINSPQS